MRTKRDVQTAHAVLECYVERSVALGQNDDQVRIASLLLLSLRWVLERDDGLAFQGTLDTLVDQIHQAGYEIHLSVSGTPGG
jgi:hypothetical protein